MNEKNTPEIPFYKKLLGYFLQGLFLTAPLGVTLYILYQLFYAVDNLFTWIFDMYIPGLGIVILIVAITILGFIGGTIIAKPLMDLAHRSLMKIPVVKELYVPLREFFKAFMGKERKFNRPVLVRVNNISNLEKVGFLTQEDLSLLGVKDARVAVYFPHSYAFSGELFIVPAEAVKPLDIPPSDAMKFIVSGGAVLNVSEERENSEYSKK